MIPRPQHRVRGTRAARSDVHQRRLESLAAEFALLAQRRARVVHQIDLLDQQRSAAALGFAKMQARMAWLARRMDALDPDLRDQTPEHFEALARPAPAMPARATAPDPVMAITGAAVTRPAVPGTANAAPPGRLAAGRNWATTRQTLHGRPSASGERWRS